MKFFTMKISYILLLLVMSLLPLLQMKYDIFTKMTLNGVTQRVEFPKLSYHSFISGEYQKKFEMWFNQNFGLREYYVKINNQIYYSLFNQTPPNSQVMIGKEKQLFEKAYINEYLNIIQPITPELLEKKVIELKKLQDLLQLRGKPFLLFITPSKTAIYPEYIPDQLKVLQTNKPRNYDTIIPLLNKYGVNYVDGHKITIAHKNSGKYPMFPQGGTHWNLLASYYSSKAVLDKLEQITQKKFISLESSSVTETIPTGFDRDLANLINVWNTPLEYKTVVPKLVDNRTGNEFIPNILMEGGSFSFQFVDILHQVNAFKQLDFYYYYHTYYQYKEGSEARILGDFNEVDWKDVMNHDVFIIEMNEQNIPKLLQKDGFFQDAINYLEPIKLSFSKVNNEYVEMTTINGMNGFIFKKGANGNSTLFIESDKIKLIPGTEYTLSYTASGFNSLKIDLYPDDLPQKNQSDISEYPKEFKFDFKSDSLNMRSASLRFFIDGLPGTTDKDTVVYDIKLEIKNK